MSRIIHHLKSPTFNFSNFTHFPLFFQGPRQTRHIHAKVSSMAALQCWPFARSPRHFHPSISQEIPPRHLKLLKIHGANGDSVARSLPTEGLADGLVCDGNPTHGGK